ncbi:MAG: hypothetical protein ACNI3C_03425 [Candidatus Marinarcus sp.]|uniref:hypothetical protein n=1 Tax=Candidatus Marinarcus sp. TaxID=3100987 RepID=UPI003B0052DC
MLLPEMQFEYALLDFKNLHISKKVQKLLQTQKYTLVKNGNFENVLEEISNYHETSWLTPKYIKTLQDIRNQKNENFELISFELITKEDKKLIAGEIGYTIGKTYTSLTGFLKKTKAYNHCGKLQLVLLALHLQENNFDFWNLGHASLHYKLDLGAEVFPREKFLKRWLKSTKQNQNP